MTKTDWIKDMRKTIRRNYGNGWSAFPSGKKTRLCFTDPTDGGRSSVTTDVEWAPKAELAIPQLIGELRQLMDERGMTLPQAMAIKAGGEAAPGRVGWPGVKRFLKPRKTAAAKATWKPA